ncbi:EARLY ENDOSOME ANTIGEN [Salix purpurea]|uniref:EARLY ENDOSOME ANTIGEN n=1 Tax=Salix purpurea TaxID=77065 RepID=A0A9Q0Q5Y1_SALPP|nr:EARLY ENDOSOME ANTIGEN [Salix purpurea]
MEEYQEKIRHLESSLNQSSSRNSKLEEELKIAKEQCAGHEDRAKMHYQRSLELEDLFQTSHSKLEDAGKKAREFALLLEAEKYRVKELEEQNSASERKCVDAEADSRKYSDKISELASEIEVCLAKSSSLEVSLQMVLATEKELTESLNLVTDEKKRLEEALSSSKEKLTEAENLVGVLRNELTVMQEKLESIENDLKAAGLKESDIMAKLKSAEEQLEQQEKLLEEATTRKSELESLHETLKRDSEIKLQEALTNFANKVSEAESLSEKLNTLEDQVNAYKEQITQVTGRSAVLKEELDSCLLRMVALETSNEELKSQVVEAETKFSSSSSENELLVETNNQLKSKIDELQELLNSAVSEREVTSQQLASHASTITEITDKHSRTIELHSATESQMMRAEMQLQEAIRSLILKDVETKDLNEKLNALEEQVKLFEEQSHEASTIADSRKTELEETLLKITHLETVVEELKTKSGLFERESGGLAEDNLKLALELASYESKLRDLEAKLSAILSEKDGTAEQLHISKKAVDDLRLQLTDVQSQISSVMEENNLLNETCQHEKELQSVIIQLEEQLKGQEANEDCLNSEIESLKAEVAEKSALQTSLEELEKQLMTAEAQLKEQKEIDSQKLEKEAALKKSLADLEARNKETSHLENQVKELEQKLHEADAKLLEKQGDGSSPSEQKGGEIKSRDIGAAISTPTKRKSKKKLEAASTQVSSPSETHTQTADVWPAMNFKFTLGVALVSIIIGAILGRLYWYAF